MRQSTQVLKKAQQNEINTTKERGVVIEEETLVFVTAGAGHEECTTREQF